MNLLIYRIDDCENERPVCVLEDGEHVIGRGDTLKCNDKRASRTHAYIKVENGSATITSTHQNPCFFQSANSKTLIILTENEPMKLEEGDKFGIFPDSFWFKIKFQNGNLNEYDNGNVEEVTSSDNNNKINIEENEEQTNNSDVETTTAIPETNTNLNLEQCDTSTLSSESNLNSNILPNEAPETVHLSSYANGAPADSSNDGKKEKDELPTTNNDKIGESDKNDLNNIDDAKPSSSGTSADVGNDQETKPKRDKCWYGDKCYRRNTNHREEFSHPGDSDYESDPNDTRPLCRYGKKCYRKNADHQKKYRHSGTDSKQSPKRHGKKRRNCTKKLKKDTADDESEDEYDFDDPFIDDDSEDEYNEESWSESDSDDDSSDSANANDENSENTRSLIKEAKRFTKRKK